MIANLKLKIKRKDSRATQRQTNLKDFVSKLSDDYFLPTVVNQYTIIPITSQKDWDNYWFKVGFKNSIVLSIEDTKPIDGWEEQATSTIQSSCCGEVQVEGRQYFTIYWNLEL